LLAEEEAEWVKRGAVEVMMLPGDKSNLLARASILNMCAQASSL
jgi:hypothetical protein